MFLFNYQSHNRLVVNDFFVTNFDRKIEPSSGHYTRAVKIENVLSLARRSPTLHQKIL